MRHFNEGLSQSILDDIQAYLQRFEINENCAPQAVFEAAPSASFRGIRANKSPAKRVMAEACDSEIQIPEKKPSFCDNLFRIIDDKYIKDSEVYKKADIDRRLFSKMRSDSAYHPAKSTAIRLCLALELDIAEAERLLESAGYCLSLSSTEDLVVRYCIEHKIFSIVSVNEAIDYFSGKLI